MSALMSAAWSWAFTKEHVAMTPHKRLIGLDGRRRVWASAAGAIVVAGGLVGVWLDGAEVAQIKPTRALPPAKAALIQKQQLTLSEAQAHPMPKSDAPPPPMPGPAVAPTTGIVWAHQGPFSAQEFVVSNSWTGYVNGHYYTVFAGSKRHPLTGAPAQAGVILYADPSNINGSGAPTKLGTYLTGTSGSSVAVRSANGSTIVLSGQNGGTITFDIATRRFG